ncbi:MAG: hypothetical protein M0R20_03390 [Candidatus Omnitrophica bacterium]|jgi:hypothetical protein|nr:hypothetical protein [Candidatus Omnitrophota bacterium]
MAIFRFFNRLFNRHKKKRNKKAFHRPVRKKTRKSKPKIKPVKRTRKRIKKKPLRKSGRKLKKTKQLKKKRTSKRVKARVAVKEKEIGKITHYFDKISVGIIKLKSPLAISEHIHIKGKSTDFTQVISSMQYNHKDITLAERGLEIGIRVTKPVHENDIVSKV